jgi:hypothetical protein
MTQCHNYGQIGGNRLQINWISLALLVPSSIAAQERLGVCPLFAFRFRCSAQHLRRLNAVQTP